MDKKTYTLRMLRNLQNTWPLAGGLIVLIEANPLDETLIDLLISTFTASIKTMDDSTQKAKLQQASNFLQRLKAKEMESNTQDQKDIDELDAMLAKI